MTNIWICVIIVIPYNAQVELHTVRKDAERKEYFQQRSMIKQRYNEESIEFSQFEEELRQQLAL